MRIEKSDLKNYVGKKIRQPNIAFSVGELKYVGNKCCFLVDDDGIEYIRSVDSIWETYEEPKQQVKMWQALMRDMYTGKYFISVHYFEHEDAVKKYEIDGRFIKLLPHTEIEVEV